MKISTAMLYEAIRERADVRLLGKCKKERNLRFLYFYDGEAAHLKAGGVYLAEPERLRQDRKDILWVTWGEAPAEAESPVLVFTRETEPLRIMNLLQEVFLHFCTWEEQLDQILASDSNVEKMIEATEPMVRHPLCVVDSARNYLGCSASFMDRSRELQLPTEPGKPAPAVLFDPARDLVGKLHNRDYALGTLYMLHTGEPFSETERLLFGLLTEKLSVAMQNLSLLRGLYENTFKQTLEELFITRQMEESRLYDSLTQWGGRPGDSFLCFKVKASHINQKINAEYVCSIFENMIYASVSFWQESILVVLADVTRSGCRETEICQKMERLLRQLDMKAGVSLPFTDLPKVWYHFRQACCAFEEGYPVYPEKTLYFFSTYVPSYILHHAVGEFPRKFLLDQGMQRLLEHDSQYAVSYLDTLDAYFKCGMNMSQTAQVLAIHRTSLNARMQKIRECLDHELTREYLLYVQIMLAILKMPT